MLLNLPWNLRQKKTQVDKQTVALVCSLDHWVCATVEKLASVAWGELVKVAMKLYLHIFFQEMVLNASTIWLVGYWLAMERSQWGKN